MSDGTTKITYSYGESSIAGKSVPNSVNEDSISSFLQPLPLSDEAAISGVFCVADGFGGPGLGNAASKETANLIRNVFSTGEYLRWGKSRGIDITNFPEVLRSTVSQINYVIHDYAVKHKKTIGSALDVIVLKDSRFYIAHVGNGRIYLLRKGVLYRLTQDHPAETGSGTIESTANVLGNSAEVSVDVFEDTVQYGDAFVICSDGITKAVSDEEIKYALINFETPQECADKLAKLADKRNGTDNISLTVVKTTMPVHEEKPPLRRVPMPDIHPKSRISPGMINALKISVIVIAVLLAGFFAYRFIFKAPSPVFIVQVNPDNTVRLTIQNIAKSDQYYIYRQENKPIEPESNALPDDTYLIGQLTRELSNTVDDSVEPGKIYYYSAYRIKPGWPSTIVLESQMTERAVIGGTPVVSESGFPDRGKEKGGSEIEQFTQIYNRYVRLTQDYGNPLSSQQKERLLDTVREYVKILDEVREYIKELRLIENRTDLVVSNKDPKILRQNFEELKGQIENTISKDGFEPYLSGLREQAVKTDFAYPPFGDIASLVPAINDSPWQNYDHELQVFLRIIEMDREMLKGFKPDKNILILIGTSGLYPETVLSDFYSNETLKKPETIDEFYKNNNKLTPNQPLENGTKILIANPEYEIGGDKLIKQKEDLIGESSPYYYALKYAAKISDQNLANEYKGIIELYKFKTLFWYEINNKSKKMEENLRNINTEGMKIGRLYQDSYLRKGLIAPRIGSAEETIQAEDAETQKRIKNATDEFDRLRKFFEQEEIESNTEAFDNAVRDFKVLKEMVVAEDDTRFEVLKELVLAFEANVDFISAKLAGDAKTLIERADTLVGSAGEDVTAGDVLREAKSLYEKALLVAESDNEKKEIEARIKTVNEKMEFLAGETGEQTDISKLRWDKQIDELTLAESVVFLQKLIEEKNKHQEDAEAFSAEIESAKKRIAELSGISQIRIIQKIEPLGPDFDEKKFEEGITELRFISFALMAIITDPEISDDLENNLEGLADKINNAILKNHLTFEGTSKKIKKLIPSALNGGDAEIKSAFEEIVAKETLDTIIGDSKSNEFIGDIRMFADDIAERTEKNIWGRGDSYFVEIALLPKHNEIFPAVRKLWDDGLPLIKLKFHTDKISKEKSYRLAIGWYKNRGYAEEASSQIQENPDIKDLIISVTVLGKSGY